MSPPEAPVLARGARRASPWAALVALGLLAGACEQTGRAIGGGESTAVPVVATGSAAASEALEVATAGAADPRAGSGAAAPLGERVRLETAVSTEYYEVEGDSPAALFAWIEEQGPGRDTEVAAGLTSSNFAYRLEATSLADACDVSALGVELRLVVTLPQLAARSRAALSEADRERWAMFAARVASHEQRHVDIEVAEAERLADELRRRVPASSCGEVEAAVDSLVGEHRARTEGLHAAFHDEDAAAAEAARRPLEQELDELLAEADAIRAGLDPVEERLDQIEAAHPELVLPEPLFSEYQRLQAGYREGVDAYNALVFEINALVERLRWLR